MQKLVWVFTDYRTVPIISLCHFLTNHVTIISFIYLQCKVNNRLTQVVHCMSQNWFNVNKSCLLISKILDLKSTIVQININHFYLS